MSVEEASVESLLPTTRPQPGPNQPASVSVTAPAGRVLAGFPVSMSRTVSTDPGVVWHYIPGDDSWEDEPAVTFTGEIFFTRDNVEVFRGGTVTFPTPGDHTLTASAPTTSGEVIVSAPVTVHVTAPVPPAFTVTAPVAGAVVPLGEGGGRVDVTVAIPADQYFPVTVAIARDGQAFSSETISATTYQISVPLSPMPLGARTIAVTVFDRDNLTSTKTVTVTGRDIAPPHLTVTEPLPQGTIIGDVNGAATVHMRGTASDNQAGMVGGQASVAWALTPTGTRTAAVPKAAGDFTGWTADVPLTGFGAHTIYLWVTDAVGNVTPPLAPETVPVTVISSFVPATLDERLNERQYLAALLGFTQEQVTLPGTPRPPLDTATLVAALGQPVDRLSQPLSAAADRGGQEINQLRVPIELLRAQIAATHAAPDPGAVGEAAYRDAAYASLLASYGTSYTQLRQLRGASAADRQALADRIGIRLSAKTPDELDQLTLDGSKLTEAALETLFGLPSSTGADPLRAPVIPLMRTWQLAAQALTWADEDQHPNPPRKFPVLLDPDLVGAPDVIAGVKGDPIRLLLTQRAGQLKSFSNSIEKARVAAGTPAAGLAAILALGLPGVDLNDLSAKDQRGVDISAALAAAGLTRSGFLFLVKLGTIAATATQFEWADANAILTAAHKPSMYAGWRAQETAFVLSPDFFVLSDTAPQTPLYRADSRARAAWQSVLRGRIAQRRNLLDAGAAAVAAAEQAALPILRDALLADLAPGTPGDVGEAMSARFFVDVLAGGSLRTTRIRQAIESVQSLLLAKRSGELVSTHPAFAWQITDFGVFTAAWVWMGEIGDWRSATSAFLFAERHLDPALPAAVVPPVVATQPMPLDTLRANIRGTGPFGPADAVREANTYLKAIGITTFTYLDPAGRSAAHQDALRAVSAARPEPANREIFWLVPLLLAQRLQSAGNFQAALDWYWIVYPYDADAPVFSIYNRIFTETSFRPDLTIRPGWTTKARLDPFALVQDATAPRPTPYTRYTLLCVIRCHVDFADAEFGRETDESVANARTLYVTARRLLGHPKLQPQQPTNFGEPTLPIPELDALGTRVAVQLTKLRQGRNVAGLPRTQGPATALTVTQPTPFRFKTLLERAKQLAGQAAQMEAGYLAALEKYDQKNLGLFDALKGIDLTAAQMGLAALRVEESHDAVTAATAQQTKADTMVAAYGEAIAAPPNQYEQSLLHEFTDMRDIRDGISVANTAIGVMQAAAAASNAAELFFSGGASAALAAGISAATTVRGGLELAQNDLESQMQADQLHAGIEQRKAEWRLQQTASLQESLVAAAQVDVANDQVTIATQEGAIASLQHDQAVATLTFLSNQFTNADLYLWMSYTLGGVYRYFLQQATATARLAQAQLAFERAEPAQTLIRDDYWQTPEQNAAVDRRGLTGAEQLEADLASLDQYAFSSERRRLNLSQTFSLAKLMPVEFMAFRKTGVLSFATPMALFDQDFPGHYLRLVRQVRTSLVALVPPDRGIRATLYSNGISTVTTGQDGVFQDVTVRHDPGVVALTSPLNASGVFELDAQSDMLLPFESSGVDTTWELQLPQAANPFDFATIVDALITIDYTALYDDGYRDQVTTRLNADRDRGADCVFSLARDFPDQWYDLNNPPDSTARSVTITLRGIDFPFAIDGLATASIAVRLAGDDPVPATVVSLHRGAAGGDATTADGIASVRRGNAAAWNPLCGSSPTGDWVLSFGADARALFASGGLDDIVLVISWTGQAPAWPV
ncbi:Tc toxin subunit A-related protein [Kutzneria chonburiensis]|uniref:Tc toxin complex TcA C-terminal TcB-binding domain-containing protein n=1 Tax=Kutzneria chonburiensis TaxID=1483604 RepID=A0ABV6MNI9_9PSEU|nr:hypothetical protein [Kutzneria chonburiensis]